MNSIYEFENFRVDVEKRLLWKDGKSLSINPKTFDTLIALLKNKNEVIGKDKLVEEIWNGVAVSDDSLTQQISQLRKLLGDNPNEHKFIATVPGIGYKFVADVNKIQPSNGNGHSATKTNFLRNGKIDIASDAPTLSDENLPEKESQKYRRKSDKFTFARKKIWIAAAVFSILGLAAVLFWQNYKPEKINALGVKKIAVLPFQAVTQDDSTNSLKEGMTDTLVSRLSRIDEIIVLSSTITASFEKSNQTPSEFGKTIGADAVLEGQVQKNGEQMRVTVQLIRSGDGKVLWSEEFLNQFTDIFEVQSTIAYKIAQALSLELSDEEKRALMKRYTTSAEAYRLYLDAKSYSISRSTGDVRIAAQRNFERAIELDPNFALAYIGLANLLLQEAGAENYRKIKYLAGKALEIDPNLAEGYDILAFAVWRGDWNWQEAERLTRKALELNRNSNALQVTLMTLLYGQGKFDEAFKVLEQSPPDFPYKAGYEISLYYYARQYQKAVDFGSENLTQKPNDIDLLSYMGPAYTELGRYDEAIEATENYIAVDSIAYPGSLCYLGYTYAKMEQTKKTEEILQKILSAEVPQKSQTHGGLAMLYGALGEKDKAFEQLEKSIENREWWAFTLKVAPYYDSLRDDARFQELLRRVNLDD